MPDGAAGAAHISARTLLKRLVMEMMKYAGVCQTVCFSLILGNSSCDAVLSLLGMWFALQLIEGEQQVFREGKPDTPLLDTVNYPAHMKNLSKQQLKQLANELRAETIYSVSHTGGHLGASLGAVELTIALHHVFDMPKDKILWDVGHQTYPHKIVTGRRDRLTTIRQTHGLAPFTKRSESEYDSFGAGHSSTAMSAALGMACARDHAGRNNNVVAVVGDGAMTGGMTYEAMNNAGFLDKNMIVILNDNQQVSLPTQYNDKEQPPVGALSSTLARLQSNRPLRELRESAKWMTKRMPPTVQSLTSKVDEYARGMISASGSTLFEELGLYYIGTVDGHNLDDLVNILSEVKNTESIGPVLIHVVTEKGRGYKPAEKAQDKYHGVAKFEVGTGEQKKSKPPVQAYTQFFADALVAEATRDSTIIGIHAAMGGGTGMTYFEKYFPSRTYDVGIAEQHAVTFAAGMATEGYRPFCAIYSTFLQRAYDQIIHDVALQQLPVRFVLDRGGLVGADGPTHGGAFDITYLGCIPHMTLMAPSNEAELCNAIATAASIDYGPSALRYPRGNGVGADLESYGVSSDHKGTPWEIGKGVVLREGHDVCLLGYGVATNSCLEAADILEQRGISCTVADARFCKPLDTEMLRHLAANHPVMISVEEGSIGGFASHVMQFLTLDGVFDEGRLKFRPMTIPDEFIEHGSPAWQLEVAGLTGEHVAASALATLGHSMEAKEVYSSS